MDMANQITMAGAVDAVATAGSTLMRQTHDRESIGKIIGQGGGMIRRLREESGARIFISNEKVPETQAQEVTIDGDATQVRSALAMIKQVVVQGAPSDGDGGAIDPSMGPRQQHLIPTVLVGKVIDPSGGTIKKIRAESGARINISNEAIAGTSSSAVLLWGDDTQIAHGIAMIEEVVAKTISHTPPTGTPAQSVPFHSVHAHVHISGAHEPRSTSGSRAAAAASNSAAYEDETQSYSIPRNVARRIIGPGGNTIQRIRTFSGARVKVGDEVVAGRGQQALTLSGSTLQVNTALQMINEVVEDPNVPGAQANISVSVGPKTEVCQLVCHSPRPHTQPNLLSRLATVSALCFPLPHPRTRVLRPQSCTDPSHRTPYMAEAPMRPFRAPVACPSFLSLLSRYSTA